MADFIIKPVAAAGNKLILQDQAGGAVLTTADSGVTIASATIASATLTTPIIDSVKLTPGSVPGSPVEGQIYYNSTTKQFRMYRANKWWTLDNKIDDTDNIPASGGIITSYADGSTTYMVHTFKGGGNFITSSTISADILVVGGGGGGGTGNNSASATADSAGGGGAGLAMWATGKSLVAATYECGIGIGGIGGAHANTGRASSSNTVGLRGAPSRFGDLFSAGGGGYGNLPNTAGGNGESPWGGSGGGAGGGGGSVNGGTQDEGTGNTGGTTYVTRGGHNHSGFGAAFGGSGGGGAGTRGLDIDATTHTFGSVGGDGIYDPAGITAAQFTALLEAADAGVIHGSYRYIAGGGGGGAGDGTTQNNKGALGGKGGGGRGATGGGQLPASNGAANTGSGGGGGGGYRLSAGDGGSGIIIIRYAL